MPNNDQKDINSMDQQHVLHQDFNFPCFSQHFLSNKHRVDRDLGNW